VNPKFKRLWEDTPASVSGGIVLVVLIAFLAIVIWSGLHDPKTAFRFLFATCVGGVVAYRVFRTGCLRLDPERTVVGGLAKALGIVGAVLALVAGYFAVVVIYHKFGA
jgi:hypothetical protein